MNLLKISSTVTQHLAINTLKFKHWQFSCFELLEKNWKSRLKAKAKNKLNDVFYLNRKCWVLLDTLYCSDVGDADSACIGIWFALYDLDMIEIKNTSRWAFSTYQGSKSIADRSFWFKEFLIVRGVLWRPSAHSAVAFWSFDVGSFRQIFKYFREIFFAIFRPWWQIFYVLVF